MKHLSYEFNPKIEAYEAWVFDRKVSVPSPCEEIVKKSYSRWEEMNSCYIMALKLSTDPTNWMASFYHYKSCDCEEDGRDDVITMMKRDY